jgi:hypothetical protein
MKVELDFEELDLVLEALHDKHVACSESIDFLPKVLAVNRLYNRLIELSEEYETSRLETLLCFIVRSFSSSISVYFHVIIGTITDWIVVLERGPK